jgi:hypothetical protein
MAIPEEFEKQAIAPVKPVEEKALENQNKKKLPKPVAIEISGNFPLSASDLSNITFGSWWNLLLVPFGILFLQFQIQLRLKTIESQKAVRLKTSDEIFREAMQLNSKSSEFYRILRQALYLRLIERGEIASSEISTEELPDQGGAAEVRTFLMKLEEKRFAGQELDYAQYVKSDAQELFKKLKEPSLP